MHVPITHHVSASGMVALRPLNTNPANPYLVHLHVRVISRRVMYVRIRKHQSRSHPSFLARSSKKHQPLAPHTASERPSLWDKYPRKRRWRSPPLTTANLEALHERSRCTSDSHVFKVLERSDRYIATKLIKKSRPIRS